MTKARDEIFKVDTIHKDFTFDGSVAQVFDLGQEGEDAGIHFDGFGGKVQHALRQIHLEAVTAEDGSGLDGRMPELLVGLEPGQKTCGTANQPQCGY